MKKYFAVAASSLQNSLAYRFNTFAWFGSSLISLGVMTCVWTSIYGSGGGAPSYTLTQMLMYYAVSRYLSGVMQTPYIAWDLGYSINQGGITATLLKPIRLFWFFLAKNVGSMAFRALVYSPLLVIILYFWENSAVSWEQRALLAASILMAFFLGSAINYLVGLSAFFSGSAFGILFTMSQLNIILSGGLVPLDVLPGFLAKVTTVLPFQYMTYIPTSIATGKLDDFNVLWMGIVWLVALVPIIMITERRGIKRYEGYGI